MQHHTAPRIVSRWLVEELGSDGSWRQLSAVSPNCMVNTGIDALWTLLIGGSATVYSNANARLLVGDDDSPAPNPEQTALENMIGSAAMDAGYPVVSGRQVTFRATFAAGVATGTWREAGVDNGVAAAVLLNREVWPTDEQPVKGAGDIFRLTNTIEVVV